MQRLSTDEEEAKMIGVRVTKDMFEWLDEHCEFAKMTKSRFVRELIEDAMNEDLN